MIYYPCVQQGAAMRGLVTCLFFGLAGPALADTTAVYERTSSNFKMTVEIATNGDVRGDIAGKPGVYFLTRNGQGYFVIQTVSGLLVDRVEDEGAAVKIVAEKRISPPFLAIMKSAGAGMAGLGHLLTKGDDIVVQGRKGTPYYFPGARRPEVPPVVVMSSDPELAPLGVAMAHQFAMSDNLQFVAAPNPFNLEVETIMRGGAPIEFGGAELTTVSHHPIPPSRFELPAASESRENIIRRIDATATDQRVNASTRSEPRRAGSGNVRIGSPARMNAPPESGPSIRRALRSVGSFLIPCLVARVISRHTDEQGGEEPYNLVWRQPHRMRGGTVEEARSRAYRPQRGRDAEVVERCRYRLLLPPIGRVRPSGPSWKAEHLGGVAGAWRAKGLVASPQPS